MLTKVLPFYKYLKPVWFKFLLGLIFGILYSISSGLGLPLIADNVFPILFGNIENSPPFLKDIADVYFNGNVDGGFLLLCCLAIPAVILLRTIGSIGNGYFMTYTGIYVIQSLQIDMFKKVQTLPMAFFNKYKTGEINAGVMGYPNQIKEVIVDSSNALIKEPLTLICAISFLIYKSFENESFFMAIIGVCSSPFLIFLIRRIGIYLSRRSKQLIELGEKLGSSVIESFQSPIEIRSYNLEKKQVESFTKKLKSIFTLSMKSTRFSLAMSPSIELISGLAISIALFFGVKNGMGEGDFFALILALYMTYTPLKKIGNIQNQLKILEAPLDRLNAILLYQNNISSPQNPKKLHKPFKGDIEFKGVSFGYTNNNPTLKDISFSIPFGESVGLIGESGAGKSTLANLLVRLYDAEEGEIIFDNINIKDLNLQELRNLISYVPQVPILFNDTVLENIRIGNPDAEESEVIKAAKLANAIDFIEKLDNGFNTTLSERGNSLSGGQKQRISIARAFLKNSPILILDEATSSLDNKADKDIKEALKELSKGRTTILIAHRLTSLEHVSKRMILKNGNLIGYDGHENLMVSCPYYKEIMQKFKEASS
jgi:subfamily B ATP-binding cassette protein MsbA